MENVWQFEEPSDRILLEVPHMLFVVGEAFECVFKRIELQGLETLARELVCLANGLCEYRINTLGEWMPSLVAYELSRQFFFGTRRDGLTGKGLAHREACIK